MSRISHILFYNVTFLLFFTVWERVPLMRMETVLPVALNACHASCQTVSPKNNKSGIWYIHIYSIIYQFSLPLSQWFCIRNTVTLLSTERYKGSRGRSQEPMKKEETLCPLATCLHPVHSAHLEAPPFPFGKIFLMFGPVDNLTTLAMKSVNCRRWLFVLFCFLSTSTFWKKQFILSLLVFSFQAKFELVTSEASYIRSLSIAVDHFMMSPELCECLGTQERQWLFSKLPDVKEVSERWIKNNYNFAIFERVCLLQRCTLSLFLFSSCPQISSRFGA